MALPPASFPSPGDCLLTISHDTSVQVTLSASRGRPALRQMSVDAATLVQHSAAASLLQCWCTGVTQHSCTAAESRAPLFCAEHWCSAGLEWCPKLLRARYNLAVGQVCPPGHNLVTPVLLSHLLHFCREPLVMWWPSSTKRWCDNKYIFSWVRVKPSVLTHSLNSYLFFVWSCAVQLIVLSSIVNETPENTMKYGCTYQV